MSDLNIGGLRSIDFRRHLSLSLAVITYARFPRGHLEISADESGWVLAEVVKPE